MYSGNTVILIVIAAGIGTAAAVHAVQQWLRRTKIGQFGYRARRLMTPNEVEFYHRLRRALPVSFIALPQVSMGALIDTCYLPGHPHYWAARQEFSGRVCDFVVCNAQTLEPQLVIELDDRMHNFAKDRRRDSLVAKAGYRTLRFWSRAKPDIPTLRRKLEVALALN